MLKTHRQGYRHAGEVIGLSTMVSIMGHSNHAFCADIPTHLTKGQLIRVVIRYIEARPNRMHEDFQMLALEAFADAWPCAGAATSVKK